MFGVALLLGLVCGAVVIVSLPQVWRPLHAKVMEPHFQSYKDGALTERALRDGGRISDALWTKEDYGAVSVRLELRKLNAQEVEHYSDVRAMLAKAVWLVLGFGLLGVVGCVLRGRKRVFYWAMAVAWLLLAIGGVWAWVDWRGFFRTLHWWIFQDDSWILPDNSYSLGLYPYAMWQAVAIVLTVSVGTLLLLGSLLPAWRGNMSKG